MKKFVMAAVGGTLAGVIATTQIAGPLLAQETEKNSNVYEPVSYTHLTLPTILLV